MGAQGYITEVEDLLLENLKKIKREGNNFEYWLKDSTAFSYLKNKEDFIHRFLMSLKKIDGVKVEKSNRAGGFFVKTKIGEVFYMDVENKVFNIEEEFLDPDHWKNKCNQIKKEIEKREEQILVIADKKEIAWWKKSFQYFGYKDKTEEKIKFLEIKNTADKKKIEIYQKKQQFFFEISALIQKLKTKMEELGYVLKYC